MEAGWIVLSIIANDFELLIWLVKDCQRNTTDANQILLIADDADFPYVGLFSDVYGAGRAGDKTACNALDMVGVDFQTDAILSVSVHTACGSHATQRLGQRHGSTAMQKSSRLMGTAVYRHARFKIVGPYCRKLYADLFRQGVAVQVVQHIYSDAFIENLHVRSLVRCGH